MYLVSFNLASIGMHFASTQVNSCFWQAVRVSRILYEAFGEHFCESLLYTVHSEVPNSHEARLDGLVATTSDQPMLFVTQVKVLALYEILVV